MGGIAKRYSTTAPPAIQAALQALWPQAHCELNFRNGYELLTATILSAQNTDKNVNRVTPKLFERYPTPQRLANAQVEDVEFLIKSTGFYRQKANNIIGAARRIVNEFAGEVPQDLKSLVTLPGVARKTANVVLGSAYGIASGVVVDTHVKRVANRLHLTRHNDPAKIELDLQSQFPQETWIDLGHQLIWHGRRVCHARKPACDTCSLAPLCPSADL